MKRPSFLKSLDFEDYFVKNLLKYFMPDEFISSLFCAILNKFYLFGEFLHSINVNFDLSLIRRRSVLCREKIVF